MKRLMFLATLLCVLCVSSIVQARQPYPEYWNGDRNFPLVYGRQGYANYLDKTSLVKQTLGDSRVKVAVIIIDVNELGTDNYYNPNDDEVIASSTVSFVYDEAEMKMFMGDGVSEIPRNVNGRVHAYGEAAYYFAYGKKFHGIFSDEFYTR